MPCKWQETSEVGQSWLTYDYSVVYTWRSGESRPDNRSAEEHRRHVGTLLPRLAIKMLNQHIEAFDEN